MKLLHGHSDTLASTQQYIAVFSTYIHIAVIPKSHGGDHFRPKLSSPGFEVCALAFIAATTNANRTELYAAALARARRSVRAVCISQVVAETGPEPDARPEVHFGG